MFRYGQDPHDPYEKTFIPEVAKTVRATKPSPDGYEELFVRDNLHQLPEDLDEITEATSGAIPGEDISKKKKKKRRNNNKGKKGVKSTSMVIVSERGLDIQSGLSQIEIQPYIPLKQRNIQDDSNYNTKNKMKSSSVTSNILYDLLMKYNGFYN